MLSFRFANNLRKGLGPQMPAFKSEDIVPAFLFAVVVSFIVLLVFDLDFRLGLSNTFFFLIVLAASAAAGTLIPLGRYLYGRWQMYKWGFNEDDTDQEYLRKALLSEYLPKKFSWAVGTVGKDSFEGIFLYQPTGKIVFGASMQVFPSSEPGPESDACLKELETQVFKNAVLTDKKLLAEMLKSGKVTAKRQKYAERNGNLVSGPVVIPPNREPEFISNPIQFITVTT
jgi:hypothetical protein